MQHPILKTAQFEKKVKPEALRLITMFTMGPTPSARIIREAMERGWGMRGIEEVMNITPIGGEVFIWYGRCRHTVTRIYLKAEKVERVYYGYPQGLGRGNTLKWMIDMRFQGIQSDLTLEAFEPDLNLRMCD